MGAILRVRGQNGEIIEIPAIRGKSAYATAVEYGFVGTEEEFGKQLNLENYYKKDEIDELVAGAGKVKTVNSVEPDADGNIDLSSDFEAIDTKLSSQIVRNEADATADTKIVINAEEGEYVEVPSIEDIPTKVSQLENDAKYITSENVSSIISVDEDNEDSKLIIKTEAEEIEVPTMSDIPTKLSQLEADIELGSVKTVNGVAPDDEGNIEIEVENDPYYVPITKATIEEHGIDIYKGSSTYFIRIHFSSLPEDIKQYCFYVDDFTSFSGAIQVIGYNDKLIKLLILGKGDSSFAHQELKIYKFNDYKISFRFGFIQRLFTSNDNGVTWVIDSGDMSTRKYVDEAISENSLTNKDVLNTITADKIAEWDAKQDSDIVIALHDEDLVDAYLDETIGVATYKFSSEEGTNRFVEICNKLRSGYDNIYVLFFEQIKIPITYGGDDNLYDTYILERDGIKIKLRWCYYNPNRVHDFRFSLDISQVIPPSATLGELSYDGTTDVDFTDEVQSIISSNLSNYSPKTHIHTFDDVFDYSDADYTLVKNAYIDNKTGDQTQYNTWDCTDFIKLDKQIMIEWSTTSTWNAYYDSNKNYVSGFTANTKTILQPTDGIEYIRLSNTSAAMSTLNIYSGESVLDAIDSTVRSQLGVLPGEHYYETEAFENAVKAIIQSYDGSEVEY